LKLLIIKSTNKVVLFVTYPSIITEHCVAATSTLISSRWNTGNQISQGCVRNYHFF